jgi:hypothetical protein
MLIYLLLRLTKHRTKTEITAAEIAAPQVENDSVIIAPNVSFNVSEAAQSKPEYDQPFLLALLLAVLIAASSAWLMIRPSEQSTRATAPTLETGLATVTTLSQTQVKRTQRVIATPTGWRAVQVKPGLVTYVAPTTKVPVVQGSQGSIGQTRSGDSFDGTRFPYISQISRADLKPVAPGRFTWSGVWEGEGYGRTLDNHGELVSPREGGANIYLSLTWDETITDPSQPNLTITVRSNQDRAGQLINFSAFLNDPNTGKTLERKDLRQLPPIYRVTLDSSGWLIGESSKTLQPLGTATFAYHIPPAELNQHLPITLEAKNQLVEQRLAEIADLESAGWVVKEVPAPGASLQ